MKKVILLIGLSLITCLFLQAKDIELPEIFNANSLKVQNDKLYVVQDENVFIYGLNDFKLIKKFGKAGEGPQCFMRIPLPWMPSINIYFKEDKILVNSMGKISFFTLDGEYLKEQACKVQGQFGRIIPINGTYVMIKMEADPQDQKRYIVAYSLTKELKINKKLDRVLFPASTNKRNPILLAKLSSYFDKYSFKDYFVLPIDGTNRVVVYSKNGAKIAEMHPEYTKVKIDKKKVEELDKFFMNSPNYKRPYINDKNQGLIDFGESLPLFNYYRLADNKIYLISNYKKGQKYETFIYDFTGKLIKKTFIHLEDKDLFDAFPFCIDNGKVYQLVWDEEEEKTILKINKI